MVSKRLRRMIPAAALLLLAGCARMPGAASDPFPALAPAAGSPAPQARAAIVSQFVPAWPRHVRDAEGVTVEIVDRPMRIHTLSLGYDEITMRLVGPHRFAAVAAVTANPLYSNIPEQAKQVANHSVGRRSEDVLAAKPDLVVASPFANKDLVKQLKEAGLRVVVSNLNDSLDGHAANIRLLAHMYGEEERGEALIREIEERLGRIEAVVGKKPMESRPKIIRLTDRLNTAGKNTTVDGIIQRAGGINVAAVAGIDRWQIISLEKVVELKPDVILVAEATPGQQDFALELLRHPALQSVPAVRNKRVIALPDKLMSTLSHWNVRGVEELARLLWPEEFAGVTFADFK